MKRNIEIKTNRLMKNLFITYGYQNWWESKNRIRDFISMILIQQTTQRNVGKALKNFDGNITAERIHSMSKEELQNIIKPAGFFKQKSIYIKNIIEWYIKNGSSFDNFKKCTDDELRKELLKLKGVGNETADVIMLYIFERKVFIADQYAMKLFSRLGLGEYSKYEDMRNFFSDFVSKLSIKECKEFHAVIDIHGKKFRKSKYLEEKWLLNGR